MIYRKRLNNNVVVAQDERGREVILTGKGLRFAMPAGEEVDEARVDKMFELSDPTASRRLQELLATTPIEYVDLADRISARAREQLTGPIAEGLIVHLADHLHMAVRRHREGISIPNMMLLEIRRFHAAEHRVAQAAVATVNAELGTELDEDEAGFIALHLVNARLGSEDPARPLTRITGAVQRSSGSSAWRCTWIPIRTRPRIAASSPT